MSLFAVVGQAGTKVLFDVDFTGFIVMGIGAIILAGVLLTLLIIFAVKLLRRLARKS